MIELLNLRRDLDLISLALLSCQSKAGRFLKNDFDPRISEPDGQCHWRKGRATFDLGDENDFSQWSCGSEPTSQPVTEPEVTSAVITDLPTTQPEVTEPEITEPEVTQPPVTEPATTPTPFRIPPNLKCSGTPHQVIYSDYTIFANFFIQIYIIENASELHFKKLKTVALLE